MEITAWVAIFIAAIGCALTAISLIVKVTNAINKSELTIVTKINDITTSIKKEFYEENDRLRHELSETLKPIQTHIALYEEKHYKLEIYIRDNYIEVSTFKGALAEIRDLISEVKSRVEKIGDADISWRKERRAVEDNKRS